MNDYQALVAFAQAQVQAVSPPTGESFRDLRQYFIEKFQNPSNSHKPDVRMMAERALAVAGVAPSMSSPAATTLNQADQEDLRARAAALLVMSIIRDLDTPQLTQQKVRLARLPLGAVIAEMRDTLRRGDVETSKRFPQLELKNFASAGTRKALWTHEVEDAYGRAHDLLLKCGQTFLVGHNPCWGTVGTAFTDFFGSPTAGIAAASLEFETGKAPTFASATPTRLEVVRSVLRAVWRNLVNQKVRIYFGGRSIDAGTAAYVSGKTNPTRIHVGGEFFLKGKGGLASQAGTIVHECTHTFAGTEDHEYGDADCRQLALATPAKALSNADSYRFFVEAAFG